MDDGLVDKDKIGGSNFFWSFPSKKDRIAQIKYEQVLNTIEDMKVKVEEASARLADAKRGREDDDGERSKKLARLGELGKEKRALETELESLKENDPQAIADLEQELKFVMEAANRWTDNIFNCKSFLVKKRGMDKKSANKLLDIKDDFDCKYCMLLPLCSIEWPIAQLTYLFCIVLCCFVWIRPDPEDKIPK